MRTYLAGPMRRIPFFNFPAFDRAADDLRARGFHVISPADLDRAAGFDPKRLPKDWDWNTLPDGFELRHAAKRDLDALLSCEAIHLLPGWEGSKGANAELAVAHWVGLKVFGYEASNAPPKLDDKQMLEANRCCNTCREEAGALVMRMIVCPKCGNKRCPKAEWHGYECSGSNEPNQVGIPE